MDANAIGVVVAGDLDVAAEVIVVVYLDAEGFLGGLKHI